MKASFILLFVLISSNCVLAQTNNEIEAIRNYFKYVNENLGSFRLEKYQTFDESTDGAGIVKYYKGENCLKIRMEYFGETGKLFREYYIKDGKLVFTFDQRHNYNMPYYMDSTKAVESGFDQWLDPQKTKIEESRFYFYNDKMIRWIDATGEFISESIQEWKEREKYYLTDSKRKLN